MNSSTSEVRVSSVPEREFEKPQTIEEIFALADIASTIVYAAIKHIGYADHEAWKILSDRHSQTVDAYVWIGAAKWIGAPGNKKVRAA
ncbi:MAG TPA: hypothetical protein VGK24_05210 [Candidatus Angelobacter sp.]